MLINILKYKEFIAKNIIPARVQTCNFHAFSGGKRASYQFDIFLL